MGKCGLTYFVRKVVQNVKVISTVRALRKPTPICSVGLDEKKAPNVLGCLTLDNTPNPPLNLGAIQQVMALIDLSQIL